MHDRAPAEVRSHSRRVWDVPTRVGHWLLVVLLGTCWWTAENGEMQYHRYAGYAIVGVLAFRLYWGFFGSTTARFAHFIRGPRQTWAYVRALFAHAKAPAPPGHNPLGAWSTVVLLLLLVTQVGLGLFTVDVDGIESGPLSLFVSFDAGRQAASWHERIFDALLVFVSLHVAAVLFYWLARGQNLIARMFHGHDAHARETSTIEFASGLRALLGVILAALIVWRLASLDSPF